MVLNAQGLEEKSFGGFKEKYINFIKLEMGIINDQDVARVE